MTSTPPESTAAPVAPVVVTPLPPSESRTLRFTWLTTLWTFIVGLAPDLLELVLNLTMNDPAFAAAIEGWLPRPIRYAAMAIIIGLAQKHRSLRQQTVAPIAGTPAAESLRAER